MAKYVHIQTQKVISSYGGVGSIIESPKGALIIDDFDKWPFFQNELYLNPEYYVSDDRLLKRLKNKKGFPNLKGLVRVPFSNESRNPHEPYDNKQTIKASYFPEWFFCNNCKRFKHIKDWWEIWKSTLQKYKENNQKIRDTFFESPKCPYCYDKARKQNKKDKKRRKIYFDLEQVRFILTSPTGEIEDIPWGRWNLAEKQLKDQAEEYGNIHFNSSAKPPAMLGRIAKAML